HASEADIVVAVGGVEGDGAGQTAAGSYAVFTVREGKLVGRETYGIEASSAIDDDESAVLSAFINQHYSAMPAVPREILVDVLPQDRELLQEYLSETAGHSVKILQPERGEKKALVKLAVKDAAEMAKTITERQNAARERRENLGKQIWEVLCSMGAEEGPYDGREFRVESYDISNTNGVDTVGAMVVYKDIKADKQSYRKFRVRSVKGQDDYGAMREVLSRRFMRVFNGDEKFAVLPDIIFMDGGKGHVSTALEVIEATGFDIPVVGMVKDDHHRTRALITLNRKTGEWQEMPLRGMPLLTKYIGTMQEEVHRFAITYHHKVRSKNVEKSVLDEIPGIGPKRRRALLEAFGSVEEIKRVALGKKDGAGNTERDGTAELAEVPGMDRKSAENIISFFMGGK
ncbi:MAG: excinuclease ABC subunit UvrC, partial [Firmicutes bacterium]|nr:excinuclease ABC subunit UvrC [Bacillota bacterium]